MNDNQIIIMLSNYCENDIICAYVVNFSFLFPQGTSSTNESHLNTQKSWNDKWSLTLEANKNPIFQSEARRNRFGHVPCRDFSLSDHVNAT